MLILGLRAAHCSENETRKISMTLGLLDVILIAIEPRGQNDSASGCHTARDFTTHDVDSGQVGARRFSCTPP
jgi:hypothetical protein